MGPTITSKRAVPGPMYDKRESTSTGEFTLNNWGCYAGFYPIASCLRGRHSWPVADGVGFHGDLRRIQRQVRLSPRRVAELQQCDAPGLVLRGIRSADRVAGTCGTGCIRNQPGGVPLVAGSIGGTGKRAGWLDGSRDGWRETRHAGGSGGCGNRGADLLWRLISVLYVVRHPLVGVGGVGHGPTSSNGRCALVDRNRRRHRPRPADEVHHPVLCCGPAGWDAADAEPPIFSLRLVLVWRGRCR